MPTTSGLNNLPHKYQTIMVQAKFTETTTERFYDEEDGLYRSFWDSEGSLH